MQGRGNQSYTLQVQYICPSMVTTAMPIFVQALRLKAGCFKASDSSALPSGVLAGTLASRMSINSPLASFFIPKPKVSQRVQFPVMLCHFLEASSALLYGTLVLPAARKPFQIVPLWVVSTTKSAVSAMWYWAK